MKRYALIAFGLLAAAIPFALAIVALWACSGANPFC